jgi:large subunit ribosomal protein L2
VKPGNAMPLASIPVGTIVHNVEMRIGKGRALARSAGTYAQIVGRDESYVSVRLKLGEQRLVHGGMLCEGRRGVKSRSHEYLDRQIGTEPLARSHAA